jgi:hypothetical protein
LKPLLVQVWRSNYVFTFGVLPISIATASLSKANWFLLRKMHSASGVNKLVEKDSVTAALLSGSLGPSEAETKTSSDGSTDSTTFSSPTTTYPASVIKRSQHKSSLWAAKVGFYRDGTGSGKWEKSVQVLADLANSSTQSTLDLGQRPKGAFQGPVTFVWGEKDFACTDAIALEGVGEFLTPGSQVVKLPGSGHWTPIEPEACGVFIEVVQWAIDEGEDDSQALETVLKKFDKGVAKVTLDK